MKLNLNILKLTLLTCIGLSQAVCQLALAGPVQENVAASTSTVMGGVTGGGGNSVICADGKYYSWDYVNTEASKDKINPEFKDKTARQILSIISRDLKNILPNLHENLEGFIKTLPDDSSDSYVGEYSIGRIWVGGAPLRRINDESYLRYPERCIGKNRTAEQLEILQTVVRTKSPWDTVQYYFVDEHLALLNETSPLQLSFLYLHEWLRDFTDNATVLMTVDHFLHSTRWLKYTDKNLLATLRNFGLDPSRLNSVPPPTLILR